MTSFRGKVIILLRIPVITGLILCTLAGLEEALAQEALSQETLTQEALAQDANRSEPDSVFYFKGRVLDSLSRQAVAFTHIVNKGKNTATICDTLGYFFIRVHINDTLQLTAIGYAPETLLINDSLRYLDRLPDVLLRPTSYTIQGVMINPLGTYENFKMKVISLELPPSKYEINPSVIFDIDRGTDTLDIMPAPVMSPVSALYNWLSKEGKSRRKLVKIIEQEQFEKEISYKYSPDIIAAITSYSGFELYEFMEFCNFKKDLLLESDRYQIRDAVLEKQKIFEALRED